MPRIRKKTSKRATTFQKSKIHKKASETRKKNKRSANKDVTWKSKKEKDPGIPNSFPYKDRVLAELAEEKRLNLEQKAARIAAFKAASQNPHIDPEEENDTPGISSVGRSSVLARPGSSVALSGISSILAQVENGRNQENDIPELIDTELPTLQAVLDRADVVCEVVDARDVLGGRSTRIEDLVTEAGGKVVLLINKIDLVPREALQAWLKYITIPVFLFKSTFLPAPSAGSSSKPRHVIPTPSSSTSTSTTPPISPNSILGRDEFLKAAQIWAEEKARSSKLKAKATSNGGNALSTKQVPTEENDEEDESLVIAFMGLPNVGKSSVLNSLLPISIPRQKVASSVPTSTKAKHPQPTTLAPVELRFDLDLGVADGGKKMMIRVIDTPGWEFIEDEPEDEEGDGDDEDDVEAEEDGGEGKDDGKWDQLEERLAGDLLRRNLGRIDKVKDVFPLVNYVISRSNAQDLMLAYNAPFFESGDVEAFLLGLARAQGRVKKHGDLDVEAAARTVLRDWSLNVFPYYTVPPASSSITSAAAAAAAMDTEKTSHGMDDILSKLRARKEMRKESAKGVVRFKSGQVDSREVILDDDYTEMAAGSDLGDEDEDGLNEDMEDDEDDEDEDEDEEELEEGESSDEVLVEEGEYLIGSDEGEVLSLEDGSEPSDDDEEEEEEEEEITVQVTTTSSRKNKRKAEDEEESRPNGGGLLIKRAKKVNFPKQLEAPRSGSGLGSGSGSGMGGKVVDDGDVVGILKRSKVGGANGNGNGNGNRKAKSVAAVAVADSLPLVEKRKKEKAAGPSGEKKKMVVQKEEKKKVVKPLVGQEVKKQKVKAVIVPSSTEEGAYDFSKHFF